MLLATYLFWMMFSPRFGYWIDVTGIIALILVIRAFLMGAVEPIPVRRMRVMVMSLFTILFVYSLLIMFIGGHFDYYHPLRFLRISAQFLGGYALMRLYYCRYGSDMADKILVHLYWVIAVHATIMLLMYVSSTFRYFVFDILRVTTEVGTGKLRGKRVGGLSGALDSLSVVQAFGVLLFPLVVRQFRGRKAIIGSITLIIISFSIIISARSGIILLALFLPVVLFYTRRRIFMISSRLVIAALLLIIAMAIITPTAEMRERFAGQVERFTRMVTPRKVGGEGIHEGAVGKLLDDYLYDWPKDPVVFLFGNSTSGRSPWFYIPADPGYIIDVFGIGLVGSVLMIFFYVLCFWYAGKCFRYHKYLALASFVYAIQVLMVNGKVRFILARVGFTLSVVLFITTVYAQCFQTESYDEEQGYVSGYVDEYGDLLSPYLSEY